MALHIGRKQKSLSSVNRMINNAILSLACSFFVPQLFVFWDISRAALAEIAPGRNGGGPLALVPERLDRYFHAAVPFLVVLATVLLPIRAAMRYLREYKLWGLPHLIFDAGTALSLLSVLLLAAICGERLFYPLVLPTVIMPGMVQSGG